MLPDVAPAPHRLVNELRSQGLSLPRVGLILGSGMNSVATDLVGETQHALAIPFRDLPEMPAATVAGHAGSLLIGVCGSTPLAILQGRCHYYEGYEGDAVISGARLLQTLGVRDVVITNAAGAIRTGMQPGDLMLIKDHIVMPAATGAIVGCSAASGSPRGASGPDMSCRLWSPALRTMAAVVPTSLQIHVGTYAMMSGPNYETPAEIRMLRMLGADAVGMSTVPEALHCAASGIRVLGVSCIANAAAGLGSGTLNHTEVTLAGAAIRIPLGKWLRALIDQL